MRKLKVLDLFSGIGAYSLGLERSGGFETVAFCESDPYCRKILARHWPDVPVYDDVKELTGERLRSDGIAADFIVAGWPCQDISVAGTRRGLDGERSGLWPHIARIAGEISARGLLLENSTNLLAINDGRDFGRILGDLAALGLDVEWHCLSAAAFDAPHIRDRLWIIGMASDSVREGLEGLRGAGGSKAEKPVDCNDGYPGPLADAYSVASIGAAIARRQRHQWEHQPRLARVGAGVANRMDRIRTIGNCNPPIIVETIARAILEAEASNAA